MLLYSESKFSKDKSRSKNAVPEISEEEAQKRVRETLAKLQGSGKKASVKNRKENSRDSKVHTYV